MAAIEGDAVNLIDELEKIVAREGIAPDAAVRMDHAIEALLNDSTGGILERHYWEYRIQIGRAEHLSAEAEDLRWVRTLEIDAAPMVIALLPYNDGNVLVTRYWACANERLLPAKATSSPFRPEASARFRRDMEILAEHGKRHAYAGRGFSHWLVGESSGTIVLNAWSALKPCSPRERQDLLESVNELLARRAGP